MSTEIMPRVTHAAVGCGQVVKDYDKIIFIGDLAEVDCAHCLKILEENEARRAAEKFDVVLASVNQARDALHLAQSAEGDVNAGVRLNWMQVARDALTTALDELAT